MNFKGSIKQLSERVLFIVVFLLCACTNSIQKDKARIDANNSGIQIDSIICGICFNDNPEKVQTKIKEWASHNILGEFEYHFIYPERLNKYTWTYAPRGCWYHNDSLYCFRLSAEIPSYKWQECLTDLDTLYSHKYSEAIRDYENNNLEWYKGNLKIRIEGFKNAVDDYIWITYTDSRYYNKKRTGADRKLLTPNENKYETYLSYDLDYWNRVYQKLNNTLKDEALKGI